MASLSIEQRCSFDHDTGRIVIHLAGSCSTGGAITGASIEKDHPIRDPSDRLGEISKPIWMIAVAGAVDVDELATLLASTIGGLYVGTWSRWTGMGTVSRTQWFWVQCRHQHSGTVDR